MNLYIFTKEHEDLIAKSVDLLKAKNKDYSTDGDPLAGFKKIASDLGITPFQVWAVFASKHWQALTNFAKSNKAESEPIEGRIMDMINYSVLLHLLIIDSKSENPFKNIIDVANYMIDNTNPILDSNPKSFK